MSKSNIIIYNKAGLQSAWNHVKEMVEIMSLKEEDIVVWSNNVEFNMDTMLPYKSRVGVIKVLSDYKQNLKDIFTCGFQRNFDLDRKIKCLIIDITDLQKEMTRVENIVADFAELQAWCEIHDIETIYMAESEKCRQDKNVADIDIPELFSTTEKDLKIFSKVMYMIDRIFIVSQTLEGFVVASSIPESVVNEDVKEETDVEENTTTEESIINETIDTEVKEEVSNKKDKKRKFNGSNNK